MDKYAEDSDRQFRESPVFKKWDLAKRDSDGKVVKNDQGNPIWLRKRVKIVTAKKAMIDERGKGPKELWVLVMEDLTGGPLKPLKINKTIKLALNELFGEYIDDIKGKEITLYNDTTFAYDFPGEEGEQVKGTGTVKIYVPQEEA